LVATAEEAGVESPVVLMVAVETKEVREDEKNEVRRLTVPPSAEGEGRDDEEGVDLLKMEGRRLNMMDEGIMKRGGGEGEEGEGRCRREERGWGRGGKRGKVRLLLFRPSRLISPISPSC